MTRKNRELQYPPKEGTMEKHNSEYEFERQTEVMNNELREKILMDMGVVYTYDKHSHKQLDSKLMIDIADKILALIEEEKQAWKKELLEKLIAFTVDNINTFLEIPLNKDESNEVLEQVKKLLEEV